MMTRNAVRPIDVLTPPQNPWLKHVQRANVSPPEGVRVVRFGPMTEEDEEASSAAGGNSSN